MRRRISLYIADRKVDLDDESLVLFNYTMEDLMNPTVVKNSYSQQITLKGTPNNNRIFGDIFRLDRIIGNSGGNVGVDYNPSKKTPFAIYDEMNNILESGYMKLDSISRNKADIEYGISLFGGLGSFLFSLAYQEDGNKKTLADLDYLGTGNPESELDFVINATNVQAAWDTDPDEGDIDSIWKVLNFAPAYNGIPEGNFAPDKAIVRPSDIGLLDGIPDNENPEYTIRSGYALVNLVQSYDEWSVKDLRSYLQRPVLSMKALLTAICKPENNGGYEVDMQFLDTSRFTIYGNLWLTLPLIPSLGTNKQFIGDLSLEMTASSTTSTNIARYDVDGNVPFGTDMTANINVRINMNVSGSSYMTLSRGASSELDRTINYKETIYVLQAVAYGEDDNVVGCSKVKVISNNSLSVQEIIQRLGYTPETTGLEGEVYDPIKIDETTFNLTGRSTYRFAKEIGFTVHAQDVSYYKVFMTAYNVVSYKVKGQLGEHISSVTGGNSCIGKLYHNWNTDYTPTNALAIGGETSDSLAYTSAETLRSGAVITKQMLLSTSKTPADYLLSFCKMFGLHMICDRESKKVTILDRNQLFQDETIDLTERVDLSKPIEITPFLFNSKWYQFRLEGVGGAFADEYRQTQGVDYGIQRVNTGYDFNADVNELLDGNVFKNAVTILDSSKYFTMITQGGKLKPSVLLDQGNTYTLWNSSGENLDTEIPVPTSAAVIDFYNTSHEGYDIELARKVEFRTKDNKPVDGTDVLLFWEGANYYDYFRLSDDLPAMDSLNDGVPCWILTPGTGLTIPIFQRYKYSHDWTIHDSLDFGVPRELNIPSIAYDPASTIYSRKWKNYLTDRFDVNTKVMHCKVNFGGIQVGSELLRKFYWFDNTIWVLNKISDYSLTTLDPVDCEFVQVQDKDNYLDGQN